MRKILLTWTSNLSHSPHPGPPNTQMIGTLVSMTYERKGIKEKVWFIGITSCLIKAKGTIGYKRW